MHKPPIGVLVLSYGTPENLNQVEAYYTHIRRGVPPSSEQLQDLILRYQAIGGGSFPLREITDAQVKAIQLNLNQRDPLQPFVCVQGLKHAYPFIEDGISQLIEARIQHVVAIVLAPHYSSMSVGSYLKRVKEASQNQLEIRSIQHYHLHPKLLHALSERIRDTYQKFERTSVEEVTVVFTAHSLPRKILEMNDPYPHQLIETAEALVAQVGIPNHLWCFAWQSAGRTSTPWLGPDIIEVLHTLHQEKNVKQVMICPIGFVSDHLEVLYDIDIECQTVAKQLGMHLERTTSLNTDPLFIDMISELIVQEASKEWT